jgi:hypothetical protein
MEPPFVVSPVYRMLNTPDIKDLLAVNVWFD